MRSSVRYAAVQRLGGSLLDLWMRTIRWDVHNEDRYRRHTDNGRPVILMLWHGRLLPLAWVHRHQRVAVLASRSADGEYIVRLLQHWGIGAVRGSSSSGGDIAFREMVRTIRAGTSIAITPDGPRGPRERIKPGVVQLAQMTGAPIVPLAAAATHAWWFESWDRFLVPRPFSRVVADYEESVTIARDADAQALARVTEQLEEALHSLMRRVEQRVRS